MKHEIIDIQEGSVAEELGIHIGEYLIAFNEEPVIDILDYEYYDSQESFSMTVLDRYGDAVIYDIEKYESEHLGMTFGEEMLKTRRCRNRCIFCFVDQLPNGMRPSMYVKDDDWRLSFLMGNFITLTNLSEADIERIIRRKFSPLYISVHATDPQLRSYMTGNPRAGDIMPLLRRFADNGIDFHAQVVLCPEINDGFQLRKTFEDLLALYPHCLSLAVVPVGLTYHRKGLLKLKALSAAQAQYVIDEIEGWQKKCLELKGSHFIYASDEMYMTAGRDIPKAEAYEGFPQLGNGVGALAKMEAELNEALTDAPPWITDREISIACGVSVCGYIKRLLAVLEEKYANLTVHVYPIKNFFFGESITVTGLLTAKDIAVQLDGRKLGTELLISESMLRDGNTFLDDLTVDNLANWIGVPVAVSPNDGAGFLNAVLGINGD